MDAEHYICDTIRTCASWGRRYIAITDYDMQIFEVKHWSFVFFITSYNVTSEILLVYQKSKILIRLKKLMCEK